MYTAKLVTIKESFTIPGKDRIIAVTLNEIEDTKVIISKDYSLTDTYIYFPKDVRLSLEFCQKNNLLIQKDLNGKKIGGGVTVRCCYCWESVDRHYKNCVILRLEKRLENSTTQITIMNFFNCLSYFHGITRFS